MVVDHETLETRTGADHRTEGRTGWGLVHAVGLDHPAEDHPGAERQVAEHRGEGLPAHIVEVDIDPAGAGVFKVCGKIAVFVVHAGREPKLTDRVVALLG